jgi:hypothetical protein
MNQITLCENVAEPSTWTEIHNVVDVRAFLEKHFVIWPSSARIYHNAVSKATDVTPFDEASVEYLGTLSGHFYVVVYPEGIETILVIISIAIAAISIGLTFLLRPNLNPAKNQQEQSPNNQLANRQNKERPGERIPDIYGELWATPDLIQVPYRVFENNLEVEYSYMCLGRDNYTIYEVREDTTPIASIIGSSVEIYGPNTSPNSGSPTQLTIGAAIAEPVRSIKPISNVNGQTLIAPNLTGGGGWIGPFVIGDSFTTEIWCNFTAEAGMYIVTGSTGVQTAQSVTIQIGLTPCDAGGNPLSAEVLTSIVMNGSASSKDRVGATLKKILPAAGTYLLRARRTSNTSIASGVSVSDEVKWRDAMAVYTVAQSHFGNVTTVQTKTLPTPQSLAIQTRKLNILCSRNIFKGTLVAGRVAFDSIKRPSSNAADIIYAIATDPKIGNRLPSEIDVLGIYQAMADCTTYFGTSLCIEFCHTFDDSKVSFEEMIHDIAGTVFCVAYRRGSVLSLFFEKQTAQSKMLFNHRNKIPKSEIRTVSFGKYQNNDGITIDYIHPNAPNFPNQDSVVTFYYPEDQSAVNPRKITLIGVRNNVQAKLLGWRYYQKLLYQNTSVQFEATHEAALRILQERILVADNTRPDTQDGEVINQNGLILTLSQKVSLPIGVITGYTLYLQRDDDFVESIDGVLAVGGNPYQILLPVPPSVPLSTDVKNYARATYVIVPHGTWRTSAFMIAEKTPKQKNTYDIKASNYDDRYYSHDTDFINAIITADGTTPITGGVAPGGTYRPTIYSDTGDTLTLSPANAYDAVGGTHASVRSGFALGESKDGDCIYSGFASVSLTAAASLVIIYTKTDPFYCNIIVDGSGLTLVSDTGTVLTYNVPAGTNISFITVEGFVTADAGSPANILTITDITIA